MNITSIRLTVPIAFLVHVAGTNDATANHTPTRKGTITIGTTNGSVSAGINPTDMLVGR